MTIAVDTSAIVAVFRKEDDWEVLFEAIHGALTPVISAASLFEAVIVLDGRSAEPSEPELRDFLAEAGFEIRPVTADHAWLAGEAYRRFGKGNHPARLNYGDCFAYALAKELDLPLLFKGDDFPQTDIRPAL